MAYFEYNPVVVPNGVPLDEIEEARALDVTIPNTESSRVIISVGNLIERKQQETVIRALSVLDRDDIHYLVVGSGPKRDDLEQLASDLDISDQVSFLGYVDSHQRVYAYLWNADAFVLPSRDEAFGVAFIEAMACELPVVARVSEGPEDFVRDGETGYFIGEDEGETELAELLADLVDDPDEMAAVGKRAREVVKQDYTWEANADQIESIYRDVT